MTLRVFQKFPEESECLVCKKNTNKECFLMPIQGTNEGEIAEALPVHTDCVKSPDFIEGFIYSPEFDLVYRAYPDK